MSAVSPADGARCDVVVESAAVHVPGADLVGLVTGRPQPPACPPEDARQLLGRKGLLYKEDATRLALCAVHTALGAPRRAGSSAVPDPRTAVVACSNLGNAATVCEVAATVRAGLAREVSPLQAPNASSNIVASSVAIWFALGGPSLMLCSGATAGLDAVAVARRLLLTGRADRVVVVGAEPDDVVAQAVHALRRGAQQRPPLRAGGACVVLSRAVAGSPGAGGERPVVGAVDHSNARPLVEGPVGLALAPVGCAPAAVRTVDIAEVHGDTYGAQGVLQVALAAAVLMASPTAGEIVVVDGDHVDGWRACRLAAGAAAGEVA